MNETDTIEFMLAGVTAIQIRTVNFIDPAISAKVIEGIENYCITIKFTNVNNLTGALNVS